MEEKIEKLAKIIVDYSLEIKEDEKVLISSKCSAANTLILKLIDEINKKNAVSQIEIINDKFFLRTRQTKSKKIIDLESNKKIFELENYDAFIYIRENKNPYEEKNINSQLKDEKQIKEIQNKIINEKKWILLNYPNKLDAYKLKMSEEEMENYALDVMALDYKAMKKNINPLKELIENTNTIRIVGPKTDITFSIKDMPVEECVGKNNVPDGRIYTHPIQSTINGKITFNTNIIYECMEFKKITLDFKDGKLITTHSDINDDELYTIMSNIESTNIISEFGFGLNSHILSAIGDPIYDKKIKGSIHFSIKNNNEKEMDLILIQRKEFGGGRIYFDDVLVREDGNFVLESLEEIN